MMIINGTTANPERWLHKLEVTESEVSVENNTSKVTVDLYLGRKANTGDYPIMGTINGRISVDSAADNYNFYINHKFYSSSGSDAWFKYRTVTFTIPHELNGEKTVSVDSSFNFPKGVNPNYGSAPAEGTSGDFVLTTIPRASVPALYQIVQGEKRPITAFEMTGDVNPNICIDTNRASDLFTHKLYLTRSGEADVLLGEDIADSITLSRISFLQYCTNSKTLQASFKLVTYNGSTLIGEKTLPFTATITSAYGIEPVIGAIAIPTPDNSAITTGYVEDFSETIIAGISKLRFNVPFGVTRAYATKAKCYLNGKQIWQAGEASGYVDITPPTGGSSPSYTVPYVFTLEDSRGFTASYTMNLTIYPYEKPSLIPYSSNDAVLVNRGTASAFDPQAKELRLELARSVSSVGGLNKSTVTCTVGAYGGTILGENDGDTFTGLLPTTATDYLPLSQTFTATLTITDHITGSRPYTFEIPVGFATLHLASGGKGVAIGQYYEDNPLNEGTDPEALEVNLNALFYKNVYIYDQANDIWKDITQKLLDL